VMLPRLTSRWWAAVTTVDRVPSAAVIKLWLRRARRASGQLTGMISSWAWTETLTHRHRSALATRWWWTKEALSTQFKSNPSPAASINSNATLSVTITKTCRILTKMETLWAWSSKRQTSTSSPPGRSSSKMAVFQRLACQATRMTTRRTVSARRSPSAKTSTLSSPPAPQTSLHSSRPLITSLSRRNSSITKWWANRARTVNRCSTRGPQAGYLTSCRVTITSKWCIQITILTANSCRIASKRPKASAQPITTSTSTAYQATLSTRLQTFLSSRIELSQQMNFLAFERSHDLCISRCVNELQFAVRDDVVTDMLCI